MAGARGSTNGSGAGTRTARGAAEGRTGAGGGRERHIATSAHSRAARRTMTIGEAAARLSMEFPGVTAAVLRRLETAGQFTPARSSSGYRRYSEADLDLIRIVLSNQPATDAPYGYPETSGERARPAGPDPADLSGAEHPLTHPAVGESTVDDALAPVGAAPDRSSSGAQHDAHLSAPGAAANRTTARTGRAASSRVPAARSAAVEDMQGAVIRRAGVPRPATEALFDVPANGGIPGSTAGSALAQPAAGFVRDSQCPDPTVPVSAGGTVNGQAGVAADGLPANGQTVNGSAPAAGAGSTAASRRAERRWPDPEFFAPDLGEVALDRDQLAAAAHTDRAWVDGLVEYGLLSGNRSAGGADLLVARAAAELAQFGMEPRHLRAVAASAARVAELIASATSPGPGRDAARRERALLAAPGRSAEAAAAAVRLHAALVRAALLSG